MVSGVSLAKDNRHFALQAYLHWVTGENTFCRPEMRLRGEMMGDWRGPWL